MSLRASHIFLKTISRSDIEENINPSQLQSLFLRIVEGPCVFLKTTSRRGVEVNVNPSQLKSSFSNVVEGLAYTLENNFAWRHGGKISTTLSYSHRFRESLKGLRVLLKTISQSGIEANVNPSQL